MTTRHYDSEALRQYRQKAAELAELRNGLEKRVGELPLSETQNEMNSLMLRTKELDEFRARLGPSQVFLATYGVEVINDHTVSFVLPKGCSRIEILDQAQKLVSDRTLIKPIDLVNFRKNQHFTCKSTVSERICIDGFVESSYAKSREEQVELLDSRGLELAKFEDVAVAFALHWMAAKVPLFGWESSEDLWWSNFVRTDPGGLVLAPKGLAFSGSDHSSSIYGAAARIAAT